jgi:hypothetical protein
MKKLLVAEIVVTAVGVALVIAAAFICVSYEYPPLLLPPLLLIPIALGGIAWMTFQIFKNLSNVLSEISALLGWGGYLVACLGGGCSYLFNSPYTIQIVSWGGFAWIVGVYVTLTWAKLWNQNRLGATPAQSLQADTVRSQPQPNSAQSSHCSELLVVERWLRVINEHKHDSHQSYGSKTESKQISCSIREPTKEGEKLASSQHDVVLLMWDKSLNRHRTQLRSLHRDHRRLDRHQHRRSRCMRPTPS